MTKRVLLDIEVVRLLKARNKGVTKVPFMSREAKIEILAKGVIDGWYGNDFVAGAILGDLYDEVNSKVIDIRSQ